MMPRTSSSVVGAVLLSCVLVSCGGPPKPGEAIQTVRDPRKSVTARADAIPYAWEYAQEGETDIVSTRRTLKDLAWSPSTPSPIRVESVETLLNDPNPEGREDARRMARLMLPREKDRAVVGVICTAAANRQWDDFTTPLVRALARPIEIFPDDERAEYKALRVLHPDQPVADVAFEVFLRPEVESGAYEEEFTSRARADAWDVLSRLDEDGTLRMELLTGPEAAQIAAGGDQLVGDLRLSLAELRAIPLTGEELHWLKRLRRPENNDWWQQASYAIDRLPPEHRRSLELRHAEPIRFASEHRPQWYSASRDQLYGELESRLRGRQNYGRTSGGQDTGRKVREGLRYWGDDLTYADLLAILVTDDMLRDPSVVDLFFKYATMDRDDRSTEYGGLLLIRGADDFRAVLYPPRPGSRRGDQVFVASEEMMDAGDTSMAFYHFHVQVWRNQRYAGPSFGDLKFAARSGRTSLVLTGVSEKTMNVDLYQPDGAVIDLGELKR